MDGNEVAYEVREAVVGVITINRPHRRNAVTRRTLDTLHAVLLAAAGNEDLRALIIRGEGSDFCCGADVLPDSVPASGQGGDEDRRFQIPLLLREMKPVTIAAVRGGCAGAGFSLACACDVRIADATAVFNTAFLSVGASGDLGGIWAASKIVGAARARDIFLFPRKIVAQEALEFGLIARVFEPADFEGGVEEIVRHLCCAAPLTLAAMKKNFVDAETMDLRSYVVAESERHLEILKTNDRKEAFQAYLEKREPNFSGN